MKIIFSTLFFTISLLYVVYGVKFLLSNDPRLSNAEFFGSTLLVGSVLFFILGKRIADGKFLNNY